MLERIRWLRACNDRSIYLISMVFITAFISQFAPATAQPKPVTVFAAASLKTALEEIASQFTTQTGQPIRISTAASSHLARQIEQSAPADIYLSADAIWMDFLETRQLIQTASRINLLSNRLVMIAERGHPLQKLELTSSALMQALGTSRLVMGQVTSVPAGRYAKTSLEALHLWQAVASRIAMVEHVRAALSYVARGEAALGIVYASDARSEPKVKVLATLPETSHPMIVYTAAITMTAPKDAAAFFAFLSSPLATKTFRRHGFITLLSRDPASLDPD